MSAMKKQRKSKATARKKKRQCAKNKRLRKKGIDAPDNNSTADTDERSAKKDSLKYRFKALQEERYIIISFNKTNPDKTDSTFVRYNNDEDDVLEYDKQILKNYLDSNRVEEIKLINVREHFGDKKEDEHQNRYIANYFNKLGIPREKIKLTNHK